MAEPKLDTPPNALGGFDIFTSSPQAKEMGFNRFKNAIPELIESNEPTSELLFKIHSLITPDVTAENLHPSIREDMKLGLMLLDRPDKDRVFELANSTFDKLGKQGKYKQLRLFFNDVRSQLKKELSSVTKTEFKPTLKGGLRSYGSREIGGFPPEPVVYASHTLVMASDAQIFAIQLGAPDIIFPDSYYGLSTGLPFVYEALCNKYDSTPTPPTPASGQLKDILFREAYFQILGTRLLHPFWDGNGRAFTAQLAVSLKKQGLKNVDLQKLQKTSITLGYLGDSMVERVLEKAKLSLVTDRRGQSLHLAMWLNPHMREDYMTKLQAEIVRAIEIADKPGSDYYDLVLLAQRDLELAIGPQ